MISRYATTYVVSFTILLLYRTILLLTPRSHPPQPVTLQKLQVRVRLLTSTPSHRSLLLLLLLLFRPHNDHGLNRRMYHDIYFRLTVVVVVSSSPSRCLLRSKQDPTKQLVLVQLYLFCLLHERIERRHYLYICTKPSFVAAVSITHRTRL